MRFQVQDRSVLVAGQESGDVAVREVRSSKEFQAKDTLSTNDDSSSLCSVQAQHDEQLTAVQAILRRACTVHLGPNQRLFYMK